MRLGFALLSVLTALSFCVKTGAADPIAISAAPPAVNAELIKKQSPMVTGNGFGYAVLNTDGVITKLYAHPYRFERPNPDESKDGYDSTNFLKSLTWEGSKQSAKPEISYLNQSQILKVKSGTDEAMYFLPFSARQNAFIVSTNQSQNPVLIPEWLHKVKSAEFKDLAGKKALLLSFDDCREKLLILSMDSNDDISKSSASKLQGGSWAFISLDTGEDAENAAKAFYSWKSDLSLKELVEREIAEHEKWRVKENVTFCSAKEKELWRQNETFLRMSQIQEPNTQTRHSHGLILASLPDGMWFTPWVRDMAYAVVGLVRMGHLQEAKEGLLAWFNARPVGKWKHETRNLDYQISVTRYFGDGSEEADYSGLQTPNVEFDDWGLALWAVSEYFEKTHDLDFLNTKTYRGNTVYESMRDFVVSPLFGNLDKYEDGLIVTADSSLWEEHQQNKKHFAFSTFSNISGLRGFLKIAEAMKDEKEVALVKEKLPLLEKGFNKAFIHDGVIWGTAIEPSPKNEIDGSLIEAFNMDVVTDPSVRQKTMEKMELLKTKSGGYKRLRGPSDYEKQEFVFVDFHMVRCWLKMGKRAEAQGMIDKIVDKSCQDHGLIAECYVSEKPEGLSNPADPVFSGYIGDPSGSIPMVGYGAGIYAMTLYEREHSK